MVRMDHAFVIRISFFFSILLLMVAWESFFPKRTLVVGRSRWSGNLGISAVNALITGFAVPVLPVAMAEFARWRGWGFFNHVTLPEWFVAVTGVIILDIAMYLQHAMFHAIPALWRLHGMHHADHDIDATTGLRFHPLEILISHAIKIGVVVLAGAPPASVLAFEIILNGTAMFNHGNVRMPRRVDGFLRCFMVTPDMHRVHHSIAIDETNSNFGFNLPWWDYLFGTYTHRPAAGHENMTIGVSHLREMKWQNLFWMMALPFVAPVGPYPLGRRRRGAKE